MDSTHNFPLLHTKVNVAFTGRSPHTRLIQLRSVVLLLLSDIIKKCQIFIILSNVHG